MSETLPIFLSIQEARESQHALTRIATRHPELLQRCHELDQLYTQLRYELETLYNRESVKRASADREHNRRANALRDAERGGR